MTFTFRLFKDKLVLEKTQGRLTEVHGILIESEFPSVRLHRQMRVTKDDEVDQAFHTSPNERNKIERQRR